MLSHDNKTSSDLLSIGDVAKMTGISVFTLRMWERRYGHPSSVKLASGHRRFQTKDADRLKLVKIAVDAGEKASMVLLLSDAQLKDLAGQYLGLHLSASVPGFAIEKIIGKAKLWDELGIQDDFESQWQALGPLGFITERASSLLHFVGKGWEDGQISIATEHFISGILENFLQKKWANANAIQGNRKLLLSTLEGEKHAFGLHFCAVAGVVSGAKVIFLGTSVPEDELIAAAISSQSSIICLSVSQQYKPNAAIQKIKYLRKKLPKEIEIVIGGGGAPANIKGVHIISRCQSFYDWLSSKEGHKYDE